MKEETTTQMTAAETDLMSDAMNMLLKRIYETRKMTLEKDYLLVVGEAVAMVANFFSLMQAKGDKADSDVVIRILATATFLQANQNCGAFLSERNEDKPVTH